MPRSRTLVPRSLARLTDSIDCEIRPLCHCKKKFVGKSKKSLKRNVPIRLSADILIDAFQFLNRHELATIQLANRFLNEIICRYFAQTPLLYRHINLTTSLTTLDSYSKVSSKAYEIELYRPFCWKNHPEVNRSPTNQDTIVLPKSKALTNYSVPKYLRLTSMAFFIDESLSPYSFQSFFKFQENNWMETRTIIPNEIPAYFCTIPNNKSLPPMSTFYLTDLDCEENRLLLRPRYRFNAIRARKRLNRKNRKLNRIEPENLQEILSSPNFATGSITIHLRKGPALKVSLFSLLAVTNCMKLEIKVLLPRDCPTIFSINEVLDWWFEKRNRVFRFHEPMLSASWNQLVQETIMRFNKLPQTPIEPFSSIIDICGRFERRPTDFLESFQNGTKLFVFYSMTKLFIWMQKSQEHVPHIESET